MTTMQMRWRMPVAAGAASSALLLALCIQRCVSFQTVRAPPSLTAPRWHPSLLASPARPIGELFAIGGDDNDAAAAASSSSSSSSSAKKEEDCDCSDDEAAAAAVGGGGPDILQPYLPAMDPKYSVRGPVGESKKFLLSRSGPATTRELSNENILRIVKSECSDLEVNTLVWKCMGYRFDEDNEVWSPDEVFPNWKERFPDPPDFIGMQRVYSRDVDQASLRSNQALVRSIPTDNKQSLKTHMKPLGWKGFQYKELTPNKTRRAQCANWLVFYREELFGYTVEELRERRRLKKEAAAAAAAAAEEANTREGEKEEEEGGAKKKGDEWKYPLKEVY